MKKLLLSMLVAFIATAAVAQKASPPPPKDPAAPKSAATPNTSLPIGSNIPNEGMMLMGVKEPPVSLRDVRKPKGLLVMFSCNTCPFVIKAQPRTAEAIMLSEKFDIGMIIINSNEAQRDNEDSYEAMKAYALAHNYTVPYVRDDNSMMADLFGASHTPEVFLFNGEGKLVYKGALEDNPAEPEKSKAFYLADAMRSLSQNRPVKTASTRSIGCGIKRRS